MELFRSVLIVCLTSFFGFIGAGQKETCNQYPTHSNKSCSFAIDYKNDVFLKDGKPFHYISGSFHYFRAPRAYWRDRLRKLKQAGLNCVCTYIEWSFHAPYPGSFYFEGDADIEHFIQLAEKEGLDVILRVGPYICAERDFGGFPWWLLKLYPNIRLRTNDTNYQYEVKKWFDVLFVKLVKYLHGNRCGPVILIQIENEYGSYFECNMEYKIWLRDLVRSYVGRNAVLFTVDGSQIPLLQCGRIPGVFQTVDFPTTDSPKQAFANLSLFQAHGPRVSSEFYPGTLSHWGEPKGTAPTSLVTRRMRELIGMKADFNFYMFYGGTNFAFKNGANFPPYKPQLTSYDYDAPLDEAGDPTPKYFAIRQLIAQEGYYKLVDKSVPKVAPKGNYGKVELSPVLSIFDTDRIVDKITLTSRLPKTFEEMGVPYGYVLYETTIPRNISDPAVLYARDLRDRAIVYVNNNPAGILSRMQKIYNLSLLAPPGRKLKLLCENQGRVNFGNFTLDTKGLIHVPLLDGRPLYNWKMTGLPFQEISWVRKLPVRTCNIDPPALYIGELVLPCGKKPLDTYIDPTGWGKGIIFVNECNLGRYWPEIGSQVTLYVPGLCLHSYPRKNYITVFETEYTPLCGQTMKFVDKPSINKIPPNGTSV